MIERTPLLEEIVNRAAADIRANAGTHADIYFAGMEAGIRQAELDKSREEFYVPWVLSLSPEQLSDGLRVGCIDFEWMEQADVFLSCRSPNRKEQASPETVLFVREYVAEHEAAGVEVLPCS